VIKAQATTAVATDRMATHEDHQRPSQARRKWWLAQDGKHLGPFGTDQITLDLKSGEIDLATLVCPVVGDQWEPLSDWPEFEAFADSSSSRTNTIAAGDVDEPILTNPRLPSMGNALCVYAIAVSPAIWLINLFLTIVSGAVFHPNSRLYGSGVMLILFEVVISLGAPVLLVIGGIKLRKLKRSGVTIIKITLWSTIGAHVLYVFFMIVLFTSASEFDYAEDTTASTASWVLGLPIGMGEFVFMILSLVWLHTRSDRLDLT